MSSLVCSACRSTLRIDMYCFHSKRCLLGVKTWGWYKMIGSKFDLKYIIRKQNNCKYVHHWSMHFQKKKIINSTHSCVPKACWWRGGHLLGHWCLFEWVPSQQRWLEFGWYLVVFYLWGWKCCFNTETSGLQPNFNVSVPTLFQHWNNVRSTTTFNIAILMLFQCWNSINIFSQFPMLQSWHCFDVETTSGFQCWNLVEILMLLQCQDINLKQPLDGTAISKSIFHNFLNFGQSVEHYDKKIIYHIFFEIHNFQCCMHILCKIPSLFWV